MKSKCHFNFEELKVYQKPWNLVKLYILKYLLFQKSKIADYQLNLLVPPILLHSILLKDQEVPMKSFINYLRIAKDSSRECVAATTKALLRNYITFVESEINRGLLVEIIKMLTALIKYLKNKNPN